MLLSSPIVVWPSITLCEPILVRAPMVTFAPTIAYGPISTVSSTCAPGSTIAVGWILLIRPGSPNSVSVPARHPARDGNARRVLLRCVHFLDGTHQFRFAGNRAFDFGDCLELPDAAHVALERHVQDELVARFHHALEARAVDAHEVVQRVLEVLLLFREREQRGGLGQRFENHHAGHDRTLREMAREKGLVDRHILQRLDALVRLELDDPVHHQERIAVRQQREDLVDVEVEFFDVHGVSAHAGIARVTIGCDA
ncbi:hypothetical protein PT2222_50347 [Paraburkholderia tropica]